MENTNYIETIDILNVYVWRKNPVYYLVELNEEGKVSSGYSLTLIDIFF